MRRGGQLSAGITGPTWTACNCPLRLNWMPGEGTTGTVHCADWLGRPQVGDTVRTCSPLLLVVQVRSTTSLYSMGSTT